MVTCGQPLRNATASAIVVSPNRGNPVPTKMDGELTVSVGPPSATLSLEIIDCKNPRGTVFVLHGIRADRTSLRSWGEMRAVVQGYAPVPLTTDFVNGAVDLAGKRGGFGPDAASPVVAIARTRAAVLLIHGTDPLPLSGASFLARPRAAL